MTQMSFKCKTEDADITELGKEFQIGMTRSEKKFRRKL